MINKKILVTGPIAPLAVRFLQTHVRDVDIPSPDKALSQKELLAAAGPYEVILTQPGHRLDAAFFKAAPQLKLISHHGVTCEGIDLQAAQEAGVTITHTPGVLVDATAEVAWALLLGVARCVSRGHERLCESVPAGDDSSLGVRVVGKTLGIVGSEQTGVVMARMAQGFHMNVLYSARERNGTLEQESDAIQVDLDHLLKQSDFVALHVDLGPREPRTLLSRDKLALMRSDALLINVSPGPVLDGPALAEALENKKILGAGLVVFEKDSVRPADFKGVPNAVLVPHTGLRTQETGVHMSMVAAQNIVEFFKGKVPA